MKTHLALIMCVWVVVAGPVVGDAEQAGELIEQLSTGRINWTRGVLLAKGTAAPQSDAVLQQGHARLVDDARRQTAHNMVQTVAQIRVDARRNVAAVMAANEEIAVKIEQMAVTAPIIQQIALSDGSVELTAQMSLFGGFAQLMLPADIKQVESIRAVTGGANDTASDTTILQGLAAPTDAGVYSGLIVDARGIGALPAMVPMLLDENGREVYSSAFVSREFAVQHGVCEYVRTLGDAARAKRVAPNPLMVRGLRPMSEESCNIVISNADASKLRGTSAHLNFLKQCRVIIVMD